MPRVKLTRSLGLEFVRDDGFPAGELPKEGAEIEVGEELRSELDRRGLIIGLEPVAEPPKRRGRPKKTESEETNE